MCSNQSALSTNSGLGFTHIDFVYQSMLQGVPIRGLVSRAPTAARRASEMGVRLLRVRRLATEGRPPLPFMRTRLTGGKLILCSSTVNQKVLFKKKTISECVLPKK